MEPVQLVSVILTSPVSPTGREGHKYWCWGRPSNQHVHTKGFAGCLQGSDIHKQIISNFPSHQNRYRILAVLPLWQGSVASLGRLALQLSPTGWEGGRVDGLAAWLLEASVPSWLVDRRNTKNTYT
ncbi:hypothetical protein JOQ06_024147 [Pogonophryne albipinna]|uniref:Uncharacterized protein n=1 Tax=Pogonophryne albipinna TaxID=1090488 RepID=A0AAD6BML4_9TELE|nr:hypothetical protein JOQ06_024147 [Pogonophryne albipinna]